MTFQSITYLAQDMAVLSQLAGQLLQCAGVVNMRATTKGPRVLGFDCGTRCLGFPALLQANV